jgi:uncharacterized protein
VLTRRMLIASPFAVSGLGVYCAEIEPFLTMVTRYRIAPRSWPIGAGLTVAILADIHACEPWMTAERIADIVQTTNRLKPDAIVLLGDYVAGHSKITRIVPDHIWARELARLRAPLGVYAILGNHDWWADTIAQARGYGPIAAQKALEKAGITVLENDHIQLSKHGHPFWIAGLGDQWAFYGRGGSRARGVDDVGATLAEIPAQHPIILLVHEPDIFPKLPDRVTVTLAGHTHGGQIRIFGYTPIMPSLVSRVYSYGHFVEGDKHLIVSGGLGCSWWPIRFGVPPEIVVAEIGTTTNDEIWRTET